MTRSIVLGLGLLTLGVTATVAAADEYVLEDALLLPSVGQYGRAPLHVDPVQSQLAAGVWTPPRAGDEVARADGTSETWFEASAEENGWLQDRALRRGYAYWSVNAPEERVMILLASGHGTVYANGEPRAGDTYANGWVRLPVQLRAGRNDFLFHVPRGRLRARLIEPKAATFFQNRETTLPDIIVGEPWAVQGGIIVANATGETLDDLVIRAGGAGLPVHETPVPPVPALTVRKVPFWFGGPLPPGTRRVSVTLELLRSDGDVRRLIDTSEIGVRVRKSIEHHKRTFISAVDGSVQYYAVVPMAGATTEDPPALFLTLHGAGVEGAGQARVYRAKSWGHVVAPTNRRPFGFDWEDWGRLDALEVLALSSDRYDVDPDRTYLTGHSMGGHGVWHLGLTYPDRFAAIGPSAGWRSFWAYTGTERFGDASVMERLMGRATNPGDTEALSRNALHHGVYILHGEKDDNVPVDQARFMHDHLIAFHSDVVYHEQPGAGHWWGNRCCDWDPMFEFFAAHRRTPPAEVDAIEFHTANPGVSASSSWATVEQQLVPLEFSWVRATLDRPGRRYVVETGNVARITLGLDPLEPGAAVSVELDGQSFVQLPWPEDADRLAFTRGGNAGVWAPAPAKLAPTEKGPHRYGPFKDAFRNRVMFVYGTAGDADENAWARAKARYDAETFWYRGNAAVDVVADTTFDPDAERDRNVVLYGNADTNSAWGALLGAGPVHVDGDGVNVGPHRIDGDQLGVLLIRPRPGSDGASVGVVGGTSVAGMRLTDRLPYFVSGVAYPDCLVIGPGTLESGVDGVRLAGYFGCDWSVESGDFAAGE